MNKVLQKVLLCIVPQILMGQWESDKFSLGIGYEFGHSNIIDHSYLENRYNYLPSSSITFDLNYRISNRFSIDTGAGYWLTAGLIEKNSNAI